jgi:hypothetical protein
MNKLFFYLLLSFFSMNACCPNLADTDHHVDLLCKVKGSSKNRFAYYQVKGKEYRVLYPGEYGFSPKGEYGWIRYDVNDPSDAITLHWLRAFDVSEETMVTKGRITRVYAFHWCEPKHGVQFVYSANGTEFERGQTLPPRYKTFYQNLEEGQTFDVEYLVSDPQRAFMLLK